MERYEAYGPTLLRVALGVMWLAHSAYLKIVVFTIPGTVAFFESLGLPAVVAYGTIVAEIAGGILLILVALGATWAHSGYGWVFSNEGGGWEYPLFLAIASVVQVLLGPGALRLTVPGRKGTPAWAG